LISCATGCGNDLFQIPGEIPNRGVDLGQRDLHILSLKERTSSRHTLGQDSCHFDVTEMICRRPMLSTSSGDNDTDSSHNDL